MGLAHRVNRPHEGSAVKWCAIILACAACHLSRKGTGDGFEALTPAPEPELRPEPAGPFPTFDDVQWGDAAALAEPDTPIEPLQGKPTQGEDAGPPTADADAGASVPEGLPPLPACANSLHVCVHEPRYDQATNTWPRTGMGWCWDTRTERGVVVGIMCHTGNLGESCGQDGGICGIWTDDNGDRFGDCLLACS